MKTKKIPMRKCVACNQNMPKQDLLRVVNNKELGVKVDITGKLNGRGAYICKSIKCVDAIKKGNRLGHALGCDISESIYEEIVNHVENN